MLDIPQNALPDIWSYHARTAPNKCAIRCGADSLTWGEFGAQMNRIANAVLGLGIARGDRIAFVMSNTIEHLALLCGAMKGGACVVSISTLLTPEQITTLVDDSGAVALFTDKGYVETVKSILPDLPAIRPDRRFSSSDDPFFRSTSDLLDAASEAEPDVTLQLDDLMNISYSSGTTGLPKGVVYSHRARQIMAMTYAIAMKYGPTTRSLLTTPVYSNGTWITLWPALLTGGEIEIMPTFTPEACLRLIAERAITHAFMVPTQFIRILDDPGLKTTDMSSLRMCITAGSTMTVEVKRRVMAEFGPCLHELYGYSEGGATIITPEELQERPASVGRPTPGFELRILDGEDREAPRGEAGEIVFYGGWAMRGYHGNPEQTELATWRDERNRTFIRSGDIGRLDEDGYLYVVDRKKDMIISGGFNVFPSDIEAILSGHADVIEAAVIGAPHDVWGEVPVGYVIARRSVRIEPGELQQWANERLAKTQRLSKVFVMDEFPRNALGKVVKRDLRSSL